MKRFFLVLPLFLAAIYSAAQVKLPQLVQDSMILQRDAKINIWGWASKEEKISVKFANKTYKTKANTEGKWSVILPAMKAGGPYQMDITGKNKISLKEILIGDVWFCSGQSNMVHQMNIHDVTYAKDIEEARYPEIRQFLVPVINNLAGPQEDFPSGSWDAAIGNHVRPFSAVAYFFAKKLYDRYHVPIGLINANVGGTPVEAWTSEEGLKDFAEVQKIIQKNKDTAYINEFARRAAAANANRQPRPPQDKGITSLPAWYDVNYVPQNWKTISVPGYWEDQGIKDLNGVVWYRREIDVPASMTGKTGRIFLGRIVDADVLYINGKEVGKTTYMYPQRRYALPADLLKPGKNLLVIRVTNNTGKGGFVPDKPYCLFTGNDTIDLKGTWQYKVGEVYVPRTGGSGGGSINAQNQPAALFNAMVAPVVNYNIKGFIWYQGESNASRPQDYAKLQAAQITDWRKQWKQPDAPFLFVQLPGFMDYNYLPSESNWALLREAQLKTLSVTNTAMAVAIDLGEWNDIHPDNKKDVGERLALGAMNKAYGENIVYSGPIYQSWVSEGSKIIISFTNTGGGLVTNDGEDPGEFSIAGADKKFVWAHAAIVGNRIVVWNENVQEPMYVRYAWADNPVQANLYNKEGLPASPFRTDK